MTTNNELEFPLTFCLLPLHIVWGPTLSRFQPQSFCSRISSDCGFCTVGVSLWIFCIYLLVCTWRLECCFFFAFVIIFASYKILFSVYFLPIYSKNKLNKLIYLKTECFSRFFCGCTVNFVHCVSVCPTEEHFSLFQSVMDRRTCPGLPHLSRLRQPHPTVHWINNEENRMTSISLSDLSSGSFLCKC